MSSLHRRPEIFKCLASSKTFLLGEYAVLAGAPALVVSSQPCFSLRVWPRSESGFSLNGIAAQSPAGRFAQSQSEDFSGFDFEFSDPHEGLGGFGASSAQYLLLEEFLVFRDQLKWTRLERLLKYREFASSSGGILPSGADYLAQSHMGLVWANPQDATVRKVQWPFADYSIRAIATGTKLATHEHLKNQPKVPQTLLEGILDDGRKSLDAGEVSAFILAVQEYSKVLESAGLLVETSRALIKSVSTQLESVGVGQFALKGCGAMGSDVLALIYRSVDTDKVLALEELKGLRHWPILTGISEGKFL